MRVDIVVRSIKFLADRLLTCRAELISSRMRTMAEDGEQCELQQQQMEHDSDSEHEERQVSDGASSSSSPTIMAAGGQVPGGDADEAAAAAALEERADRVFDIVLPSPTGPPPSSGASASALTSPATPSTSGGCWSMSSSTDGSGTLCHGDERLMLTELGRRFYNRRALSDVKLRVGDRVYRCHKLLLALSSDVLERMLCSADWNDAVKQVSFTACFLLF